MTNDNINVRNMDAQQLFNELSAINKRRVDLVVSSDAIKAEFGSLKVSGTDAVITAEGVTTRDGDFEPTLDFDLHLADRLGIPRTYMRRIRHDRPDLYDSNVNGWLHGCQTDGCYGHDALNKRFYLRALEPKVAGDPRTARALFSSAYRRIDNLDVLTASLSGINQSGATVTLKSADLSDRRMVAKFIAPEITAVAQELLKGYRDPRSYRSAGDDPIVSAGFRVVNSETGFGAATVTPEITVNVCGNGMALTHLAERSIHVGKRQEIGVVDLSDEALAAELELIKVNVKDTVAAILRPEWLSEQISNLTEKASKPVSDPGHVVERVGKELGFSEEVAEGVLADFIGGGQLTAGGVMNAITSYSQTVESTDLAHELETKAVAAMSLV